MYIYQCRIQFQDLVNELSSDTLYHNSLVATVRGCRMEARSWLHHVDHLGTLDSSRVRLGPFVVGRLEEL